MSEPAAATVRDARRSAPVLVVLAAIGIALCLGVAYLFPSPPDWSVQRSEPFELRAGAEGAWAPHYEPEPTRHPYRRLCVGGDVDMYVPVAGEGFTERLRDVDVRVVVRVTPRDAVREEYLRDHGVDGWIPAESSWQLQVDPPRVERVDWRVEARPGATGSGSGRRVTLAIVGPEDSVIDLEKPATVAAVALALFLLLPALVGSRRGGIGLRADG